MTLDKEFEQEQEFAAFGSQSELSLLGSRGPTTANREPMVVLVAEIPALVRAPMTKAEQQRADLFDFERREVPDVCHEDLQLGPHPNEAPDAVRNLNGPSVRLEAAQIHVPARNALGNNTARWTIFKQLRSSLISRSAVLAGALRRNRGCVVYTWFTDGSPTDGQFVLLPRKDPTKGLGDLLIDRYPSKPIVSTSQALPHSAPPDAVCWSEDQFLGLSWGDLPTRVQSPFSQAPGFELGLAAPVSVKRQHIRAELRRIDEHHDTPASDVLIVSANSGVRRGLHFPPRRSSARCCSKIRILWTAGHRITSAGSRCTTPREDHDVRWLIGQLH